MKRRTAGFTLVEVLLATALLAAGMAMAFLSLRNAGLATEKAQAQAAQSERLRAVQGFVRRQLAGALTQPIELDPESGEALVFELQRREIRFVSNMPGYLSRGGAHVQTLRLVPDEGDGLRLEFIHQLLGLDGPIDPERPPEILLRGIADGAFEARALSPEGLPQPWSDRWESPGQLPPLLRLRIEMGDSRQRFPELVVAPKLGLGVTVGVPVNRPETPDEDEGDGGRARR